MNLVEWFNPNDVNHISAWKHVIDTGVWPVGFLPEGITIPNMWVFEIQGKMAGMWVNHILKKE